VHSTPLVCPKQNPINKTILFIEKNNSLCFVIYIIEKIKAIERRITKSFDPSGPPSSASKTLF
jgi:hypothetical protein